MSRSAMPDDPIELRFDAETHPRPADRIAAWRDAMSLSVDAVFTPEQADTFAGSLSFYPLGSAMLVDARCTPHTLVRDRRTIARSGSAHVLLDVFLEGGFRGVFGGRPVVFEAGDCLLMDFRFTMRADVAATRFIGFVVPRAVFEAQAGGARSIHGQRFGAETPEARLVGSLLENLVVQAPRLSATRAGALGLGILGLIAACTEGQRSWPVGERPAASDPTLVRVRRHIERHASDPGLDPERLCAEFGLSRTALYRLFRPEGGIAAAIRRRRTDIARRLLGDGKDRHRSIEAVARASGFSNARALRRALHDLDEASPATVRRSAPDVATPEHRVAISAMFDIPGH